MAILKFSDKDKMASKIMPAGWYSFEVVAIGEPKKSSSGKSFNMISQFRVIEDPVYDSKELEIAFNTNMKNPSVMGSLYLMPHTYLLYLAAATAECTIEEVPADNLDTESLKGLKFDGKVERIISDGIVMNTISGFLPFGAGKAKESDDVPF
jgi:hypothetical protein